MAFSGNRCGRSDTQNRFGPLSLEQYIGGAAAAGRVRESDMCLKNSTFRSQTGRLAKVVLQIGDV
ncbi:hypothetical protein CFB52_024925 [Burkholderia sp. AU18528]|nr:hypothetical protein CFB52_024925 [Burkholderia sp. AU18528]RQX80050.1 hypothetical protein DF034_25630 [Burkholderia anthina]